MNAAFLNKIFDEARTHNSWQSKPVDDALLKEIFDHMRYGPTSANCSPLRMVFVKSPEAKAKLKPCLAPGNVDKTMTAPVTVIFAQDMEFYEQLPKLFPHTDARSWFAGKPAAIEDTASRNAVLQAAYFMIAARALGLDCGPMSGFDRAKTDETFFSGTNHRSNFICNLGYGDPAGLHPRSPRFEFSDVCRVI
jgi:3-hydroxypropanoate dehydrogenase